MDIPGYIPVPDTFFTHEHKRLAPGTVMLRNSACPRCLGEIPNKAYPGAYPGALSRTDNLNEICSACGTAEGLENMYGVIVPQSAWKATSMNVDGETQRRSV